VSTAIGMRRRDRSGLREAVILWGPLRLAVLATAIVGIAYVFIAAALFVAVQQVGYGSVDSSLRGRMADIKQQCQPSEEASARCRVYIQGSGIATVLVWQVQPDGSLGATGPGVPNLPPAHVALDKPFNATINGAPYRMYASEVTGFGVVVLGSDVSVVQQELSFLVAGEGALAVPILGTIFLVSFLSGRRSAVPVEQARERQLAFTADASHELRTPLQVIEAETSLALLKDRPAASYRQTVERVAQEGRRLRTIVDDLLWLARFEHEPTMPERKLLDLRAVALTAHERFEAVASRKGLSLDLDPVEGPPPLIIGPPDWIERLAGVLVDNACRYTPEGGHIRIATVQSNGRSWLTVEDSGPGVPPEKLARVFDRFHRASNVPGGAGLGLSIADGIVRATGGHWRVGKSPHLGGACFEVSWPPVRMPRGDAPAKVPAASVPPPPPS
jgi:signal transduction histidine kinase